jgi:hypothetical protein
LTFFGSSWIWLQASRAMVCRYCSALFGGIPKAGGALSRFGLDSGRGTSGWADGADAVRRHDNFFLGWQNKIALLSHLVPQCVQDLGTVADSRLFASSTAKSDIADPAPVTPKTLSGSLEEQAS